MLWVALVGLTFAGRNTVAGQDFVHHNEELTSASFGRNTNDLVEHARSRTSSNLKPINTFSEMLLSVTPMTAIASMNFGARFSSREDFDARISSKTSFKECQSFAIESKQPSKRLALRAKRVGIVESKLGQVNAPERNATTNKSDDLVEFDASAFSSDQTRNSVDIAERELQLRSSSVNRINRIWRLLLNGKRALKLNKRQVEIVRTNVFSADTFYVTGVEQTSIGTMFLGNLRTNSSIAFDITLERTRKLAELRNIRFLLLQDPLDNPLSVEGSLDSRPFFLAAPPEAIQIKQALPETSIALLCFVVCVTNSIGFSVSSYILSNNGDNLRLLKIIGANNELFDRLFDVVSLDVVVPLAAAVFAVQLVHEISHSAAAQAHNLKIGVPNFIPSYPAPLVGSFRKLLSLPQNRTALFDFALSGPAVSGGISLGLYLYGLVLSTDLVTPDADSLAQASAAITGKPLDFLTNADAVSPPTSEELVPVFPSARLQCSLLLGLLAKLALPNIFASNYASLHPFAVVGFLGVTINSLQLIPIGSSDGGRIATALFGRSVAQKISIGVIYSLGISALLGYKNPLVFFVAIVTFFFQRAPEVPSLEDASDVDLQRKRIAFFTSVTAYLSLLPFSLASFWIELTEQSVGV